jgi:hypothetical protein
VIISRMSIMFKRLLRTVAINKLQTNIASLLRLLWSSNPRNSLGSTQTTSTEILGGTDGFPSSFVERFRLLILDIVYEF